MHYDNIEIGTSDFDTLIELAKGNGISVEPIPAYFDKLPDRERWKKINVAISNFNGSIDIWYVNPEDITNEPWWVRGCNSVNHPHPTIKEKFPHLLSKTTVECITITELYNRFNIESVQFLKIDTEGHDVLIVNSLLDSELPLPKRIKFENNVLTDKVEYGKLKNKLERKGYKLHEIFSDTICDLI